MPNAMQPISLEWEGVRHTMILTQFQRQVSHETEGSERQEDRDRMDIMFSMSPINSYLFDAKGRLLHGNNQAIKMIHNSGAGMHRVSRKSFCQPRKPAFCFVNGQTKRLQGCDAPILGLSTLERLNSPISKAPLIFLIG